MKMKNTVITSETNPISNNLPVPSRVTSASSFTVNRINNENRAIQSTIETNISNNHDSELSIRERSSMRSKFLDFKDSVVDHSYDKNETINQRNARIRNRRGGAFTWLPVIFGWNDLLHGSYWFLWGSILAMFIPVIPLVALFEDLWPNDEAVVQHTAVYSLLVVIGFFYSIGSYFFLRVFEEPSIPPLFNSSSNMFSTDEMIGSWCFLLGTAPSIPIVAVFVYEDPHDFTFGIALAGASIATVAMAIFVYKVIPTPGEVRAVEPSHALDFLRKCWCNLQFLNRHLDNDWLLAAWVFLICSIVSSLVSIGNLWASVKSNDERGIYDWTTGAVDCIMFVIGSAYFVAGSYAPNTNENKRKTELTAVTIITEIN